MIFLPQLPLYVIAIICGLLSFVTTRISMPIIIRKLENAEIVGTDLHKSWKPIVAEMGGFWNSVWFYCWNIFWNMPA